MKYKLIILPDNKLIVSDELPNKDEYALWGKDKISKIFKKTDNGWYVQVSQSSQFIPIGQFRKIIASETKLEDIPLIDPKQVESLLPKGFSLAKLAIENYPMDPRENFETQEEYLKKNSIVHGARTHFKIGYMEATKVYKYTEDDLKNAYTQGGADRFYEFDKFLASLASPIKEGQEYEVEIEMKRVCTCGGICNDTCKDVSAYFAPEINKEGYILITSIK